MDADDLAVPGQLHRGGHDGHIDRLVIVGASLAGLRAAEALRAEGFAGHLTLIGDEPYGPYDRPAVEHWGNAVQEAATAAHNMACAPSARRAHKPLPAFWSNQFGVNIKSVGLPTIADEVVVTQGTVAERRFAAAYGQRGRLVAAVTVNMPRWLESYHSLIEAGAVPAHAERRRRASRAPANPGRVPSGGPAHPQWCRHADRAGSELVPGSPGTCTPIRGAGPTHAARSGTAMTVTMTRRRTGGSYGTTT